MQGTPPYVGRVAKTGVSISGKQFIEHVFFLVDLGSEFTLLTKPLKTFPELAPLFVFCFFAFWGSLRFSTIQAKR